MNVLLTCVGRRNYMVRYFKEALLGRGLVCATDVSPDAPAMYVADRALSVPPVNAPDYIDRLLNICIDHDIRLVVPLNDLELPILSATRSRFSEIGTTVVVSSPEVIDIAFDKWRTAAFLTSCGLTTCATYLTMEEAVQAIKAGTLRFPLIVKPRWGTSSICVDKVDTLHELELAFHLTHHKLSKTFLSKVGASDARRSVMIQKCLQGDEYGLDVVNDLEGRTVAVHVKRKLAMRAGETDRAYTVHNRELEKVGYTLGSKLRHVGNLDCDVFMTSDGPRILEFNPRFGGGYPFSHEAGANLPAALIAWVEGREPDPEWFRVACGKYYTKCDCLVRILSEESVRSHNAEEEISS